MALLNGLLRMILNYHNNGRPVMVIAMTMVILLVAKGTSIS